MTASATNGSSAVDPDLPFPEGFTRRWVETLLEVLAAHSEALGELDRVSGDGDFGANLLYACRRAREEVAEGAPTAPAQWLTALSRGFLDSGGTSGPLFGLLFRDIARCCGDQEPTLASFYQGVEAGLATIRRYGKADVGHKTMVDALAPAAAALRQAGEEGDSPLQALSKASKAASSGADQAALLIARRGRASYVGGLSRGVADPGAQAAALMFGGAVTALETVAKPGGP